MRQAQPDPQEELDELIEKAGDVAIGMVDAYEPLEAVYRNAVTSTEVFPEASNTTGLPMAFVSISTSVR
jgi:hypothetical protein